MSRIKSIFIRSFNYSFLSASARSVHKTGLLKEKKVNLRSKMLNFALSTRFHRSEEKYMLNNKISLIIYQIP